MTYDVFISFKCTKLDGSGEKTRDYELAKDLFNRLRDDGVAVFFSERDIHDSDFNKVIDDALEQSKVLIVVGTCIENIESARVKYEWEHFANWIMDKKNNAQRLYNYLEGIREKDLPTKLDDKQIYTPSGKEHGIDDLIEDIERYVPTHKTVSEPVRVVRVNDNVTEKPNKNTKVGDYVWFGKYPQWEDGNWKQLPWWVIAVENDKALIITQQCIDCLPYNEDRKEIKWGKSTLRNWMNGYFLKNALNQDDKKRLIEVKKSKDKIFALSESEAVYYFQAGKSWLSEEIRKAYPTEYTKSRGCFVELNQGSTGYWLNSHGYYPGQAKIVNFKGKIIDDVNVDRCDVGVRPACWVRLI